MKQLLLLIFLLFSTELLLAQITDTIAYKPSELAEKPRGYFEECERLTDTIKRESCVSLQLIKFVTTTLYYPAEARASGIQGTVYLGLVIELDGTLSELRIMRDAPPILSEEALRIGELLKNQIIEWIPGKTAQGEPVRSIFVFPIKFKIS